MMKQALAAMPLNGLPLVSLALFAAVFVGVLLWVSRKGSKEAYRSAERIPFSGEESQ